jgi:hypothetical protein
MGLKSKLASWVLIRVLTNVVKNLGIKQSERRNIIEGVKTMMNAKNEPVFIGGLISAGVSFAAAYGLDLTAEQVSITVSTIITIVTFVTRRKVTPVNKTTPPPKPPAWHDDRKLSG